MSAADEYYTRYREGLIKRHICHNGRLLEGVWLIESSGLPPNNQQWSAVRRHTLETISGETGGTYAYEAYPLLVHQKFMDHPERLYVAGGGDNPFLFGGLTMATFAIEAIKGISVYSLDYARVLFQFFSDAEARFRSGSPSGFFVRKRHFWRQSDQFSLDEISGMLLGLHFLHKAARAYGDDPLTTGVERLAIRVGVYLQENEYYLEPPLVVNPGNPHEVRGGNAWAFQHPFGRALKEITGQPFPFNGTVPQKAQDKLSVLGDILVFLRSFDLSLSYTPKELFKDILWNFPAANHINSENFFNAALLAYCILMEIDSPTTESAVREEIAGAGNDFFKAICYDTGAFDGIRKDGYHNALFGVIGKRCAEFAGDTDHGWLSRLDEMIAPLTYVSNTWFPDLPLALPRNDHASLEFKDTNNSGDLLWGGWYVWMQTGVANNPNYSLASKRWTRKDMVRHIGPSSSNKLRGVKASHLQQEYDADPSKGFRFEACGIDFLFATALACYFRYIEPPVLSEDIGHPVLPFEGAWRDGFLANTVTGELHDYSVRDANCQLPKSAGSRWRWVLAYTDARAQHFNECFYCFPKTKQYTRALDPATADPNTVGYLGNSRSNEVHSLTAFTEQCNLDRSSKEHRLYYANLASALADGLDRCHYCFPGRSDH